MENSFQSQLKEFIALLTCGDLSATELEDVAARVADAPDDPDLEWTETPTQAMSVALVSALIDHAACGDKLDEVHAQLQEMFDAAFPPFPHGLHAADRKTSAFEYHEWLDRELAGRGKEAGGYDLVALDDEVGDAVNYFVVNRKDTPRLLALAEALQLQMNHPLSALRQLEPPAGSMR